MPSAQRAQSDCRDSINNYLRTATALTKSPTSHLPLSTHREGTMPPFLPDSSRALSKSLPQMKRSVPVSFPFTPRPLPTINEAQHCPGLEDRHLPHRCTTLPTPVLPTHSALAAVYRFTGKFLYHRQPEEIMASWSFKILFICFYFSPVTWYLATFPLSLLCFGRLDRAWEGSKRLKTLYIRTVWLPYS